MSDDDIVWSDESGDSRKKKNKNAIEEEVDESQLELNIRRLTSGKGRTILEISNLPHNKNWCKKLAKEIKKSLGTGGSFKNDVIEVHGEQFDKLTNLLNTKKLKFKKIGG
jgi:translation initiation factor 1